MSSQNLEVPFLPIPRVIRENGVNCGVCGQVTLYTNVKQPLGLTYLLGLAGFECIGQEEIQTDARRPLYLVLANQPVQPDLLPPSAHPEAYTLQSGNDSIIIAANTVQGLANGAKLLVRLSRAKMLAKGVYVEDEPDLNFRGVHMCLFRPNDKTEKDSTTPDDIRRRALLAALSGYNHIFLEFWAMFPYQRQPKAKWPEAYSPEEVRALIKYIKNDLHMIPCPAQNLTSHGAWSRIISRQHVMLDQHPEMVDLYVPGGWCFTTEKPETQAFLRDIMDDLIDIFENPPYLHCGCDKCYAFGSTEEDRTKSADLLFANHLGRLNDHLASRGVRMVMWSDMLYSSMDTLLWKCMPATADLLPKNILINIWTHNNPGNYWHDISFFEDKGFETIYAPFMEQGGARSMIELCKEHHSKGILQTTWHRPEAAMPTMVYSGGAQWGDGADIDAIDDVEATLRYCIRMYQERQG